MSKLTSKDVSSADLIEFIEETIMGIEELTEGHKVDWTHHLSVANRMLATLRSSHEPPAVHAEDCRCVGSVGPNPACPVHGRASPPPVVTLPPLNAELIDILGRPNFACAQIARVLRLTGMEITERCEAEQAAALHWMLGLYLQHGDEWRAKGEAILADARATATKGDSRG